MKKACQLFSIHNLLSKTIINIDKEVRVGSNNIQISTDNLAGGTYFVNMTSGEKNVVRKVVVKQIAQPNKKNLLSARCAFLFCAYQDKK